MSVYVLSANRKESLKMIPKSSKESGLPAESRFLTGPCFASIDNCNYP